MKLQELIAKHTTDGVTDWDAVEAEAQENTQTQIGAAVSKYKNKSAKEIEELKGQAAAAGDKNTSLETQVAELLKRMDEADAKTKAEAKAKDFKAMAEKLNVDSKLVESFIKSGADLDSIDLEQFKGADVKKAGAHAPSEDDNNGEGGEDQAAQMKAALAEARKHRAL